MKTAFVFLASGFEEIEAMSIIDVLRRGEVNTVTVSITGDKSVKGAHNVEVIADEIFADVDFSNGDMLVLPGGMPGTNNLNAHDGLKAVISEYNNQGKYIAAICAAPLVFGEMGLLKGKKATCYPSFESRLIGAEVTETERVVVDSNVVTSRGPGTAIEFALQLVEILVSKEVAAQWRAGMLVK